MPARKLIERLNSEADERARAIREEAESEAVRIREEADRKAESLALKYRAREAAAREKAGRMTQEAEREAWSARQEAEEALAARLRKIAFSSLSGLRGQDYEKVFKALADEMPELDWKTVRVNPTDGDLASETFPGADVKGDGSISGGMETASEGGKVRVVNTFEKRLERAWDEILPGLLAEVHEEHSGD